MKYIAFIFIMYSSVCYCNAQLKDSLRASPFHFEKKLHDFGDIIQGESVSYQFKFRITGNEPVKITRGLSNCSCTAVLSDTSRIYQPGDTGTIEVSFDSKTKEGGIPKQGIIQRQIDIFYNGYERSDRVMIRINVLPPPSKKTSRFQ